MLAAAARVLAAVLAGQSADDLLAAAADSASLVDAAPTPTAPATAERPGSAAAVRAVALGALRWYHRLQPVVAAITSRQALAPPVSALLVAALHQLEYSHHPVETTVSSAVDAVRMLQQPRAAGLVNAVLRRFLRERVTWNTWADAEPARALSHPQWLLDALDAAYPGRTAAIATANNMHPPMTLRLDLSRSSRAVYVSQLHARGLDASAPEWLPMALTLHKPSAVGTLPGFDSGLVSVQDAGAQLASALLQARPGERVLDACAAPGGKTGALLEQAGGPIDLWAVDIDARRLQRVAENLRRLHRSAHLIAADLRADLGWWDGQKFDRILLDAPCSATGVIRRHPDIKLLRRPEDIAALAAGQQRILQQCLALLKPAGLLLYSTCSVLPAENDAVIASALAVTPTAASVPLPAAVALPADALRTPLGRQLLPGNAASTDGFYYACLTVLA